MNQWYDFNFRDNFSERPYLLGLGVIGVLILALLNGCQDIQVSIATKHIAPEAQTWTFEVWSGKAGRAVPINISSNVAWLSVNPASTTSTGPTDKKTITVTVPASVPASGQGIITAKDPISLKKGKKITVTTGVNYFTAQYTAGIPLGDTSITFSPSADISSYTQNVQTVIGYFTNPVNGAVLNFAGGCVKVDLSNGQMFPFYAQNYSSVYVNEHGRISFTGCVDRVLTLANHFATRGISGLSTAQALNGGSVSVKQTTDRLAVTYEDVPTVGSPTGINNFQMELFFNGTIRLTYLDLDASGAIIGLSSGPGAVPPDFIESELDEDYNTGALS